MDRVDKVPIIINYFRTDFATIADYPEVTRQFTDKALHLLDTLTGSCRICEYKKARTVFTSIEAGFWPSESMKAATQFPYLTPDQKDRVREFLSAYATA